MSASSKETRTVDLSGHSSLGEVGEIERLKSKEAALSRLLSEVRKEKLECLRSRPLTIGICGFGNFGQFISKTFCKHARVVATSRRDYTDVANSMGIKYYPLSDSEGFFNEGLDVVLLATSIISFERMAESLVAPLKKYIKNQKNGRGPLIVDVLSVKEYPRQILLNVIPKECDIMCTHPMFGPDSGKNGWFNLNFVYERTRLGGIILDQKATENLTEDRFVEEGSDTIHWVHEHSEEHIEGKDRMERFLSIWEEEGCKMVPLSCSDHDTYAANSQFITHLMGRILGAQGLEPTPIDTKGFGSVLNLIESTTADSFDLFYGLYKYNHHSMDTIVRLRESMDDVVERLKTLEKNDRNKSSWWEKGGEKKVYNLAGNNNKSWWNNFVNKSAETPKNNK